jgi:xanthine dehydrogenase accessory factor
MVRAIQQAGGAAVLVTALAAQDGTKLVVSEDRMIGTLGDPERDEQATKLARAMLERRQDTSLIQALADGCSVFFEPLGADRPQVVLFGAGHVGKALVRILAELPWRITWVDGRPGQFPDVLPANVTVDCTAAPERAVDRAPPDAAFLVMTHSHALDLKICEKVLQRNDFFYFGLIGSATKRAKFIRRFRLRGIPDQTVARMICPIGLPGIAGKRPAEIAIAVAAQLLTLQSEGAPQRSRTPSSIAS